MNNVQYLSATLCLMLLLLQPAIAADYCHSSGKHHSYGYIKQVSFHTMSHSSSHSSSGYSDYTSHQANCKRGGTYTMKLKAHHYKYESAYWTVWADWDHDGQFESHEKIVDKKTYYDHEHKITIPSGAKYGKTTMRVSMRYFAKPYACGDYWYGEVEDYTVVVDQHDTGYDEETHYTPKYCTVYGKNSTHGYIDRVQFNTIDNHSGYGWNGYSDFTSKSTTVEKGSAYTLTLNPLLKTGYGDHIETPHWAAWIDYNQNGKFEASEKVLADTLTGQISTSVTIPESAKEGKTRMRVAVRFVYDPVACGYYWYGEIEDYTVVINGEEEEHYGDTGGYCHAHGKSDHYGWIKHVKMGSIDKTSSYSHGGYGDYTSHKTSAYKGNSYKITLHPKMNSYHGYHSEKAYWAVWIDYDHDNKFESHEKVFRHSSHYSFSKWIKVPHSAKSGKTKMRVAMRFHYYPESCGDYYYGEVEDYTIDISDHYYEEEEEETHYSYCKAYGKYKTQGYIKAVEYGSVQNWTGFSHGGYGDFSAKSSDVTAGHSFDIHLKPYIAPQYGYGYDWYYPTAYWAVWIDYDHNGKFDHDEKVIRTSGTHGIHQSIHVPSSAKTGKTRMRVALRFVYYPTECGYYLYGEVEDYTINITSAGHSGYGRNRVISSNDNTPIEWEEQESLDLRVYPNPTSDVIYLQGLNTQEATVAIKNNVGQTVLKVNAVGSNQPIETALLPAGLYYIEVQGNEQKILRFMKQ